MSEPVVSVFSMDEKLLIDCDTCVVRSEAACGDCVITCLLGMPPGAIELDIVEVKAFDNLAAQGMVPPLRHEAG